jgi:PadR family transcriptional regulator, regulatory protein PadR
MEGADFLKLEELILLAIAGKSEIYGLEIANEIAKASEGKVQLNYGSLYPCLNRLEKKGYITSGWEKENYYPKSLF